MMAERGITIRDRASLVRQGWPRVRQAPEAQSRTSRRHLAPRRGVLEDQRRSSVPLACGRPGRAGDRYSDPKLARRPCSGAILQEGPAPPVRPAWSDRDQSTGELQRCDSSPGFWFQTCSRQRCEQPSRERERRRRRFRSASKAQRFLSTFSAMSNHFRQARHLMKAKYHRIMMGRCFAKLRAVSASVA